MSDDLLDDSRESFFVENRTGSEYLTRQNAALNRVLPEPELTTTRNESASNGWEKGLACAAVRVPAISDAWIPLTTTPTTQSDSGHCRETSPMLLMGMDDLTKLLLRRYAEIEHRVSLLKAELGLLEDERNRVSVAAEAISVDLEELMSTEAQFLPGPLRRHLTEENANKQADFTIKEAALKILEGKSNGLTANEILAAMFNDFKMHYPRSSLSPQLSRLKGEGQIELNSGRWRRLDKASEVSVVRRF